MTRAVASLAMYDLPGLAAANDALWRGIATALRDGGMADVPKTLDRDRTLDSLLADPALLLAQTCGYPLMTRWRGRLRYVATPRYVAAGCGGAWHRSLIVARADDPTCALEGFRGRVAAINDRGSNTGMNLLRAAIAPVARRARFFGGVLETGSHLASIHAVANGEADLAAIDAVTLAHVTRAEPDLVALLRIAATTPPSPGLPLVTAGGRPDAEVALLRAALRRAAEDPDTADARRRLLIDGFEQLADDTYAAVTDLEAAAQRAGYPDLA